MSATKPEVLLRDGDTVVLTRNKQALDAKLQLLQQSGAAKLQVIADFDMTLTKFKLEDGTRGMSTHMILESEHFGVEFRDSMRAIFEKYYPIEIDPAIDRETKLKAMEEWWHTAHENLIRQRVSKDDIAQCVRVGAFSFREGTSALLARLRLAGVPLLIFSAGIADVLTQMLIQKLGAEAAAGLRVVSNRMIFNDAGQVTGFEEPTIHSLNKGAVALDRHSPVLDIEGDVATGGDVIEEWGDVIRGRTSVILLGDSLGDLHMADGLPEREVMLSIGFLNDKVAEREQEFVERFDIVIEGDAPMSYATSYVAPILGQEQ